MQNSTETVTQFLAACGGGKDAMVQAYRTYFTPDTVWELVGGGTTRGADEAIAKVVATQESHGMDHLVSEVLAIASNGQSVLTERVDHVIAGDGSTIVSCPCMGIFEVDRGRITAWREYYDTAGHGT